MWKYLFVRLLGDKAAVTKTELSYIQNDRIIKMCLLRSRGTRERILIWFRRREKSRFFGLQIGRPCRFLQGLWASFSCLSVRSCLLSFVASFVVFDFLGVSLKLTGF